MESWWQDDKLTCETQTIYVKRPSKDCSLEEAFSIDWCLLKVLYSSFVGLFLTSTMICCFGSVSTANNSYTTSPQRAKLIESSHWSNQCFLWSFVASAVEFLNKLQAAFINSLPWHATCVFQLAAIIVHVFCVLSPVFLSYFYLC